MRSENKTDIVKTDSATNIKHKFSASFENLLIEIINFLSREI